MKRNVVISIGVIVVFLGMAFATNFLKLVKPVSMPLERQPVKTQPVKTQPPKKEIAGVDPRPTRDKLEKFASVLQAAERKGDRGLVLGLIDPVVALNRKMDNITRENVAMWNCKLAMIHLLDGIQNALNDWPWIRKDQFEAALSDCK